MIRSMTAFAHVEHAGPKVTLAWELRSVNHRYLELGFWLPDTFRDLEGQLRERVRQQLARGKLDCTLQYQEQAGTRQLALNTERVRELVDAAQAIAQLMEQPAPLNPMEVLAWPGVLTGNEVDLQALRQTALETFAKALDDLQKGRLREGEQLSALLTDRLQSIVEEVTQLRELLPGMLAHQRQRIIDRFNELRLELNPQRLEQELVLLAQKTDVTEELDRLLTHVREVGLVLQSDAPVGRRLDFLMQELNREANTLASKAFDPGSTQVAVNIKVLIEQMREQIQNIE